MPYLPFRCHLKFHNLLNNCSIYIKFTTAYMQLHKGSSGHATFEWLHVLMRNFEHIAILLLQTLGVQNSL
ncbi:hypothetical protein EUGRSUZ_A02737 [Eucalyptus grandis]|uniref:Uncharacterized protein n=2 Tax=Eucalyptus grandis TaxID=71139 RepID=A0ACC3M7D9_EUCGR|nr:hypothetical protein EUGRSUZ_A02737 [Eucalyptus grandis]